jgi:hypothetical protein
MARVSTPAMPNTCADAQRPAKAASQFTMHPCPQCTLSERIHVLLQHHRFTLNPQPSSWEANHSRPIGALWHASFLGMRPRQPCVGPAPPSAA